MSDRKGRMQPIRDKVVQERIKNWLLKNKDYKYYFLWILGCNTGLRISDLIGLKVKDVREKDILFLTLEKTDKPLEVVLNPYIKEEIKKYIQDKEDKDCLFPSRVGVNRPISRQAASKVIKEMANSLGLEKVNTHTMRKTFGYWYYKNNKNVYYLMKLFGHRTQQQTLQYIGIELDEIKATMQDWYV